MNKIKQAIEAIIREEINNSGSGYYREPLIGYAAAGDPIFLDFPRIMNPQHLQPADLLKDAQTVVAFFLPFTKEIIVNNRRGMPATREWAEVYVKTNELISRIGAALKRNLAREGVTLEAPPPTYVFDPDLLMAAWSHKHIAYACGLGVFGRNHLLITSKGCGGRFGSAVLNAALEATARPRIIHRCFYHTNGCNYCRQICPAGALESSGFKRHACYRQCRLNNESYRELGSCEVCGKCATGPCAYLE